MKKILRAISILLVLGVVTISFLGCRSPTEEEGRAVPGQDVFCTVKS